MPKASRPEGTIGDAMRTDTMMQTQRRAGWRNAVDRLVGEEMAVPKTIATPHASRVASGTDSRMPVADVPSSDDRVSNEQPDRNSQEDSQAKQHERIHRLLTSNFGFGDNRNERDSHEEHQRRRANPPRPFLEEVADESSSQDDLREVRAHPSQPSSLLWSENPLHGLRISQVTDAVKIIQTEGTVTDNPTETAADDQAGVDRERRE